MLRAADTISLSDTGRQRRENEDCAWARAPVFVVADGMGGAQAGEVAARIAVEAFAQGLPDDGTPEERLADRAREANRRIYELSRTEHEHAGMGTTLTAAYLDASELAIAHVGDSRAYLFRGGSLKRLTQDHSLVDELVRRGKLTEEQAAEHPQRSIITRALGPEPSVEVDTWTYPVASGDVLLLCSDGLTSMVSEDRMEEILRRASTLKRAGQALIDEANAAGGRDNITVVLALIEDAAADGAASAPSDGGLVEETGRLEPVAVAATAAPPAAARRRGGWTRSRKIGAALTATAIVIALILAGGYLATRSLYFVGTDAQGIVTIYRGLPYDLPAGIHLYETFYVSGVPASFVPPDRRKAVFNNQLRSQSDASNLVRDLELGRISQGVRNVRNRELLGLLPASLLVTAGFAGVFVQRSNVISNVSLTYGAVFLALCVAGSIFIRLTLPHADPYLFPLVAVLASFGIVMIYRIDPTSARLQAQWFVLGLILFAVTIVAVRDYRKLEQYRYVIMVVSLGLLVLPRLPGIGYAANGAYLGVRIPGLFVFQPAEVSKIGLVIFLASYLRDTRQLLVTGAQRFLGVTIPPLKHFGPVILIWGLAMGILVLLSDIGSSVMFYGGLLAVLYVATNRVSFVVVGLVAAAVGFWYLGTHIPHVHARVETWLHPLSPHLYNSPLGSYQIANSLFAQAAGGMFGQGFGQATLTIPGYATPHFLLPAPKTDMIYAVITDELGLFGAVAVLLTYLLVIWRGFKVAMLARDSFSKLLVTGLTAMFALQVFVIVGGVTRVIPLTGVTLPFISYGGSSIVANFVLLALIMLVSDRARREEARR